MPTPKTHRGTPVPNLHYIMIVSTVGLLLVTILLYCVAPESKSANLFAIITSLIGFLTGKMSNQFGRPLRPASATVEAVDDDDDDETDTNQSAPTLVSPSTPQKGDTP